MSTSGQCDASIRIIERSGGADVKSDFLNDQQIHLASLIIWGEQKVKKKRNENQSLDFKTNMGNNQKYK